MLRIVCAACLLLSSTVGVLTTMRPWHFVIGAGVALIGAVVLACVITSARIDPPVVLAVLVWAMVLSAILQFAAATIIRIWRGATRVGIKIPLG